jgi:hypothetical protein
VAELPEPGKPLEFSLDSRNRLAATAEALTPEERAAVVQALRAIEAGSWNDYLWFEDVALAGTVLMWIAEDVMLAWRLYPGTDDVAQVIYAGHPRLWR